MGQVFLKDTIHGLFNYYLNIYIQHSPIWEMKASKRQRYLSHGVRFRVVKTSCLADAVKRHLIHFSGPRHLFPQLWGRQVCCLSMTQLSSPQCLPSAIELHPLLMSGWWRGTKCWLVVSVWDSFERPHQFHSLENWLRPLLENQSHFNFSLCSVLFCSLS